MADEITESFLQEVAGDLKNLLIEDQKNIDWAFKRIGAGFKINLGCVLDLSGDAIKVSYTLSFDLEPKLEPIEKHKVTRNRTINPLQSSMEFIQDKISKGEMSITGPDGTRIDKDTIGKASAKQ